MPTPIQQRQLKAIREADSALDKLEANQIQRTNAALEASMGDLLKQLRGRLSDEGPGVNLLARDRAILLASDLRDSLNVFSPDSPRTQELLRDFEALTIDTDRVGRRLGDELIGAYEPTVASTADLSMDVVAAVAKQGHDRLLARGQDFAAKASTAIQQGILQGWGTNKIATAVKAVGGVTRFEAERIVRTESSRAAISAVKERYAANNIDKVIWIATQDKRTCPRCAARAGGVYEMDKVTVPLHPSDRCYLSPFKQSWLDAGLIDTEWLAQHSADCIAKAGKADNSASSWEAAAPKKIDIGGQQKLFASKGSDKAVAGATAKDTDVKPLTKRDLAAYHKQADTLDKDLAAAKKAYLAIGDEYEAAKTKLKDKFADSPEKARIMAKAEAAQQKVGLIESSIQGHHQRFIDGLKAKVSVAEADAMLDKITVNPKLRNDAIEVVRLLGKVPETLQEIAIEKTDRAYADHRGVFMAKADAETLYHEVGHHAEVSDAKLLAKTTEWRDGRSIDGGKLHKLNQLEKKAGYDDNEVAIKDKFISPYVGKSYGKGEGTEVFSMGLEHFADPSRLAALRSKDREHFDLITNQLLSKAKAGKAVKTEAALQAKPLSAEEKAAKAEKAALAKAAKAEAAAKAKAEKAAEAARIKAEKVAAVKAEKEAARIAKAEAAAKLKAEKAAALKAEKEAKAAALKAAKAAEKAALKAAKDAEKAAAKKAKAEEAARIKAEKAVAAKAKPAATKAPKAPAKAPAKEPEAKKPEPKPATKPEPKAEAKKPAAKTTPAKKTEVKRPEAKPEPKPETKSAPKAEPKPEAPKPASFEAKPITNKELEAAWSKSIKASKHELFAQLGGMLPAELKATGLQDLAFSQAARAAKVELAEFADPSRGRLLSSVKTLADNVDISEAVIEEKGKKIGIYSGDRVVAAAVYKEKKSALYVEYLATHPDNLFEGAKPVKGAGTAAVKAIVRQSIESGKGGAVELLSLDNAEGFYQKLGFVMQKNGNMLLTPEAAKKLLEE